MTKYENHAVRSEQWRYIRYESGDEELYDDSIDPYEWRNLAKDPQYASAKAQLATDTKEKKAKRK